jgi:hypothetical protein
MRHLCTIYKQGLYSITLTLGHLLLILHHRYIYYHETLFTCYLTYSWICLLLVYCHLSVAFPKLVESNCFSCIIIITDYYNYYVRWNQHMWFYDSEFFFTNMWDFIILNLLLFLHALPICVISYSLYLCLRKYQLASIKILVLFYIKKCICF